MHFLMLKRTDWILWVKKVEFHHSTLLLICTKLTLWVICGCCWLYEWFMLVTTISFIPLRGPLYTCVHQYFNAITKNHWRTLCESFTGSSTNVRLTRLQNYLFGYLNCAQKWRFVHFADTDWFDKAWPIDRASTAVIKWYLRTFITDRMTAENGQPGITRVSHYLHEQMIVSLYFIYDDIWW